MMKLDRNLPYNYSNMFMHYLKLSLKQERKNKLLKLNSV